MQCEQDSDSDYELASEDISGTDRIDKVISETLGQEPQPKTTSSTINDDVDTDVVQELPVTETPVTEQLPPYTDTELPDVKQHVLQIKEGANNLYKTGDYYDAMEQYSEGIKLCRLQLDTERSVLHANRAACHLAKNEHEEAEEDCTAAIQLNEHYLKALLRRAQVREKQDKLSGALEDYTAVLKLEPRHGVALQAARRLPDQIKEQQEKMKEECMSKLKDLGNLVLRPFGLSTENFNMVQDPNSGGYNIQFNQNK